MKTAMRSIRLIVSVLVAIGLALPAWAQSTGTGAFARLSPGEQKTAKALFEAQSTTGSAPALTLDEIAASRKTQGGWGAVFKDMRARGLVTEKNLGQAVSSYEHRHREALARPEKPAKMEKAEKPEKPEKPEKMERVEKPERSHRR